MAPWVTPQFLAILKGLQERYNDNKGSERTEVVDEAVEQITASAQKDGVAIPANLLKVQSQCCLPFLIDSNPPAESACVVAEQSSKDQEISNQGDSW
jgi:hypothetical protein